MSPFQQQVKTYWTGRSDGYCKVNVEELRGEKKAEWAKVIHENAPQTGEVPLKVLDIGTGPGFFAILMAKCGHDVTAVDMTPAMLEKAADNAGQAGVDIHFQVMDAHNLDFEDETFDCIITRNVTWNLDAPHLAYQSWHRVLKKGGRLINFDANWYHHLFDDQKRWEYEQDRKRVEEMALEDHYTCTDIASMENIARELPLSRVMRPAWDMGVLTDLGFEKVKVETNIGDRVWNDIEKANYASTPLFLIVAEK